MDNVPTGVKVGELSSGFFHRFIHYTDDPARDDDWVKQESPKYGGINSAKWLREQEGEWDVYGGERVWPMLNRQFHVCLKDIKEMAVYRVIDHGIRHPTCCLWVGVNKNGDRHFFREYYATDRSVALNARAIISLTREEVCGNFIDPSTLKRVNFSTTDPEADKKGLTPLINLYGDNGLYCELADNSSAGYDRVMEGLLSTLARHSLATGVLTSYLEEMKVSQEGLMLLAGRPSLTFSDACGRAFRETENLRWKEIVGDETQRAESQKTVDVADEGPDCVRYAMQSDLYWRTPPKFYHPESYRAELARRRLARSYQKAHKWA